MAATTALSDSGTDFDSVYSYDTDAECDERMQSINKVGNGDSEASAAPADNIFPISSYISLRFHLSSGVCEDGTIAYVPSKYDSVNSKSTNFRTSTPMKRTGELEMQLEGSGADLSLLEISLKRTKLTDHDYTNYRYRVCTLTQEAVLNYLKKPASIQKSHYTFALNNRLGIKITRNGALEFFIDGNSRGIVAEAIYKLGHSISYYPSMHVPPGLALRLTAGGINNLQLL